MVYSKFKPSDIAASFCGDCFFSGVGHGGGSGFDDKSWSGSGEDGTTQATWAAVFLSQTYLRDLYSDGSRFNESRSQKLCNKSFSFLFDAQVSCTIAFYMILYTLF